MYRYTLIEARKYRGCAEYEGFVDSIWRYTYTFYELRIIKPVYETNMIIKILKYILILFLYLCFALLYKYFLWKPFSWYQVYDMKTHGEFMQWYKKNKQNNWDLSDLTYMKGHYMLSLKTGEYSCVGFLRIHFSSNIVNSNVVLKENSKIIKVKSHHC